MKRNEHMKGKKLFSVVPYFSQSVYNHIFVLYYHHLIKHNSYPCAKDRQSLSISHSLLQNLAEVDSTMWTPNPSPAAASHRVQLSKGIT